MLQGGGDNRDLTPLLSHTLQTIFDAVHFLQSHPRCIGSNLVVSAVAVKSLVYCAAAAAVVVVVSIFVVVVGHCHWNFPFVL